MNPRLRNTPLHAVPERPQSTAEAVMQPESPTPLYAQIKDILRARILDGTYQPHQQMPSESEMMAAFGVSRITVRQALTDLQKEGLIFKMHGKGTFVSKPKAFQNLRRLQGFGEAMGRIGPRDLLPRARASGRDAHGAGRRRTAAAAEGATR